MSDVNNLLEGLTPPELKPMLKIYSAMDVIQDARQIQIPPRENSIFGFDDGKAVNNSPVSDRLNFLISDNTHYLDGDSMYVNCDFESAALTNGNVAIVDSFLDEGGILSSIKSVRGMLGGAQLFYINEYAKWYNSSVNFPKHSREYRDRCLFVEGDSTDDRVVSRKSGELPVSVVVPYVNAQALFDAASGVLTLANAAQIVHEVLKPGDIIQIVSTAPATFRVEVLNIADDQKSVLCTKNAQGAVNVANGAFTSITKVESTSDVATRKLLVNGGKRRLCFKLKVPFFETGTYFPLPLISAYGPIEIQIEFNRAEQFIYCQPALANNKIGYQISDPKLCCRMVLPAPEVVNAHRQLAMTNGFLLTYKDFLHYPIGIEAGNKDSILQIQTNLSSIHGIVSVMTSRTRADTAGVESQNYKSQSSFLRDNLTRYRYNLGSKQYPHYDYVRMDNNGNPDLLAAQAWKQYEMLLGFDNKWSTPSIEAYEWRNPLSNKFVISAPMSKYPSYNCGVEVVNSAINIEINKSVVSTAGPLILHNWIYHDCLVRIMNNEVRVFR